MSFSKCPTIVPVFAEVARRELAGRLVAAQERIEFGSAGEDADGDNPREGWTVFAWIVNWSGPIYEMRKEA
jgi:hypothetical protein